VNRLSATDVYIVGLGQRPQRKDNDMELTLCGGGGGITCESRTEDGVLT
jgi:hypothetical protein